jgi:hypothetical protein
VSTFDRTVSGTSGCSGCLAGLLIGVDQAAACMPVYHRSPDDTLAVRHQRSTAPRPGKETEQVLTGRNLTTCENGSARLKVMRTTQRLIEPTARRVVSNHLQRRRSPIPRRSLPSRVSGYSQVKNRSDKAYTHHDLAPRFQTVQAVSIRPSPRHHSRW